MTIVDNLAPVGRSLSCEPSNYYSLPTQDITLLLNRPSALYKPMDAPPSCLYITRRLVACTQFDYLRMSGSIMMSAMDHFGIWFVERPKARWIGYGRLRKKAVETIRIMVDEREGRDWELFCRLARGGFAHGR